MNVKKTLILFLMGIGLISNSIAINQDVDDGAYVEGDSLGNKIACLASPSRLVKSTGPEECGGVQQTPVENKFYLTYGSGITEDKNGIVLEYITSSTATGVSGDITHNEFVSGKYKERIIIFATSDRKGDSVVATNFYNACPSSNATGSRQSKLNFYLQTKLYINNSPVVKEDGTDAYFYIAQYGTTFNNPWLVCSTHTVDNKDGDTIYVKTKDNIKYKIHRKNNLAFYIDKSE